MHTTLRSLIAIGSLAVIVGACSGGRAASAGASATPSVAPASAAASPAASDAGAAGVTVADSPLGKILVGAQGRTLYAFTKDTAGKPSCYEGCAAKWPPLTSTSAGTAGAASMPPS